MAYKRRDKKANHNLCPFDGYQGYDTVYYYGHFATIHWCACGFETTDFKTTKTHSDACGKNGGTRWETTTFPAVTHTEITGYTTVVDQASYDEQVQTGTQYVVDVPAHWE